MGKITAILGKLKQQAFIWNHTKNISKRLDAIRNKDKITVVFLPQIVSMWKTEALYLAMKAHPRFNPIICPTLFLGATPTMTVSTYKDLIGYLNKKNYEYVEAGNINELNPDITFYERPYRGIYSETMWIRENKGLICYIAYGINNVKSNGGYNLDLINISARFFIENKKVLEAVKPSLKGYPQKLEITGVPYVDQLLGPANPDGDPWKPQASRKKRIIWAPHFTIRNFTWLNFSSFLTMYEVMVDLARKYEDEIQIAFKPHPNLYMRLVEEWGEDRTKAYYDLWASMPNTQLADGPYIELFKYSDAMIHDCGSFLMEYLYMNKPVLYTIRDESSLSELNDFGMMAYQNHYHGNTTEIIETFIKNVIAGSDPMREQRETFFNEYLLPPNGKTACENIIDSILGQSGYK